ncbi:hypothetical protein OAV88_02420 [bacterium]|nr:hypothetical protein [bacterium]
MSGTCSHLSLRCISRIKCDVGTSPKSKLSISLSLSLSLYSRDSKCMR